MQTTGTVVLNARGVNINGYDCFVNLSKDTSKYNMSFDASHWVCQGTTVTPAGTNPYYGVSNSYTKFSSSSLVISDYNEAEIRFNTNFNPTTYTISTWQRDDPIKDYNSCNQTQKEHYRGKSSTSFGSYFNFFDNQARNGYNTNAGLYLGDSNWSWSATTKRWSDTNWHHFAAVGINGRHLAFIDGTKVFDKTATSYNTGNMLVLKLTISTLYCDDLVVIADQALWTSNFTPPTTYLLDSEYAMDLSDVKRRNIIVSNVDKKLIIPDDETLKQY